MSNNVIDWFSGFATIGGFFYVLTGFMISQAIYLTRCRLKHTEAHISWLHVGIAIGILSILFTSFQSSQSYSTAKDTAKEVQACWVRFLAISNDRANIGQTNDDLSITNRELTAQKDRAETYMWLHILRPGNFEPALKDLPDNDPKILAYRQKVVDDYAVVADDLDRKISDILNTQRKLQADRKGKVLPPPSCGS